MTVDEQRSMVDLVQDRGLTLETPDHDTHDHRNHGQGTHDHADYDQGREVHSHRNPDHANQDREIHIPSLKTLETHDLIHNQDTSHELARLCHRERTIGFPARAVLLYQQRTLNPK